MKNEFIDNANAKGFTHKSSEEVSAGHKVYDLFQRCPIFPDEILENLGLFLNTRTLAKFLFINEMYKQILDVPGVVMEFGVEWGGQLSVLNTLRGIYEPYNVRRKVIGFDTFSGFPSVDEKDGTAPLIGVGNLALPKGYEEYLEEVIDANEKTQPLSHIVKHKIVKGDACIKVEEYLKDNPETIIAFAYFDFDIYEPTKKVLELIKSRLVKGSIVGFDELNDPSCPGETLAVMETLGLDSIRLRKVPWYTKPCYYVVE